jgi:hypothetical protein
LTTIFKRKFTQGWSTIPLILTKVTSTGSSLLQMFHLQDSQICKQGDPVKQDSTHGNTELMNEL